MTRIDVVDAKGAKAGSVDLPADLFDAQVNIPLIHQVVVGQLAAARQGTHDTLSRGEVSGGGRKPYRQKGTGRARQGSIRAPQFTGGGVVHGPTPHGYLQRTPKKMKAAALRGALSDRAREGRIHIVEHLVEGDRPSTKTALAVVSLLTDRRRPLVVVERQDEVTKLSLRNAATIHVLYVDQLNTYDVLSSDDVIFTRGAYDTFVATRSTGGPGVSTTVEEPEAVAEPVEVEEAAEVQAPEAETAEPETAEPETAEPETAEAIAETAEDAPVEAPADEAAADETAVADDVAAQDGVADQDDDAAEDGEAGQDEASQDEAGQDKAEGEQA